MATLQQARAAKVRAKELLRDLPELRGIGIARAEEGFCLKVNLERWPAADLPGEVDGVPVRVELVGEIRSLTG